MTWAIPAAWALAAAVVLPLVAHLWSRRTPRSLPFPTLRFLPAASPVSRRLRTVQDWPLFLLRAAIVVAVGAAAAGPTIATRGRVAGWQARLHRIVVVQPEVEGRVEANVARLQREASSSEVVKTGDWDTRLETMRRLAARFAAQHRTEVVFLWDGTRSRLPARELTQLPTTVGVSLQPVPAPTRAAPSFTTGGAALPLDLVLVDRDRAVGEALREALALVPGASAEHRVVAFWPGSSIRAVAAASPAMVEAGRRDALAQLAGDARLAEAASRSRRDGRAPSMTFPPSTQVVARSVDGVPLLRAWVDGARLAIGLEAEPTSPLALWSAVAALDAVAAPNQWAAAAGDDAWTRAAIASVTRDASASVDGSLPGGLDTRAAWVLVLVLVMAEQWWRSTLQAGRRTGETGGEASEVHDAA
jgi:hypothetical protein